MNGIDISVFTKSQIEDSKMKVSIIREDLLKQHVDGMYEAIIMAAKSITGDISNDEICKRLSSYIQQSGDEIVSLDGEPLIAFRKFKTVSEGSKIWIEQDYRILRK